MNDNATMLGSTVACITKEQKNIGKLLWVTFLKFFLKFKKQDPYNKTALNALTLKRYMVSRQHITTLSVYTIYSHKP
jgi:hypothetical protein